MNEIETTTGPKRRLRRTVAVALGLGMAIAAQTAPASAEGAETFHYGFKGKTAEARFYTQSGCVGTEAYVHAVDGRVRRDGRPEANSGVFVAITRFDICTQQHLGFEIGSRPDVGDAFQIDRLEGATLDTTVEVAELVTGASRQMHVQLQWTGIFDPMRAREHRTIEYPGVRLNIRESGTSRQANVGGVLSDGTVDYASGAWASGTLSSLSLGSVAVSRLS